MFKVFISAESLEKICIDEMSKDLKDQSSWFIILTKQHVIYLDKNIYEHLDYTDPLFTFSESYQIEFRKAEVNYNEILKDKPETVLNEPQAAFLLDVNEDAAEMIQKEYGVICQSTDDLTICKLAAPDGKLTLFTGSIEHSWKELFNDGTKMPSNALIIIDRYIFGYESKAKSGYDDGIINIERILLNVLPPTLNCDYHVLILFDEKQSSDRYFDLSKVDLTLERFKRDYLKRPYNIEIELFSVSSKAYNYECTHNREIISNYFISSADHLLKAFRKDGRAICNQDLRLEYLYSHGLRDRSDSAVKTTDFLLNSFSEMKLHGIEEEETDSENASQYKAMLAGKSIAIRNIKNRLISK